MHEDVGMPPLLFVFFSRSNVKVTGDGFFKFPVPNWEHFEKMTEVLSRVRPSVRPSVCLSVCPSVAKRSAQTAYWILIKFGVNMQEGMGMPPLLFIFF